MKEKIIKDRCLISFSLISVFLVSVLIIGHSIFFTKVRANFATLEITGATLTTSPAITGITANDNDPNRFHAVPGISLNISGNAKDLTTGLSNFIWRHQTEHAGTITPINEYSWLSDGIDGFEQMEQVGDGAWMATSTEINWVTLNIPLHLWAVNKVSFVMVDNENQATELTLNLVSGVSPREPPEPGHIEVYPQCVDEQMVAMNVLLTDPYHPDEPHILSGYDIYRCLGEECVFPGPFWTYQESCYGPLHSGHCFTDHDINEIDLFSEHDEVEVRYHLTPFIQASDEFDTIMGGLWNDGHIGDWSHIVYGTASGPYGIVVPADYCHPTEGQYDPDENGAGEETQATTSGGGGGGGGTVLTEEETEVETEEDTDDTLTANEESTEAKTEEEVSETILEVAKTEEEVSETILEVAETTAETPIIEPEITTEFTATEESQEEDLEKMIEDYLKLFLAEELISQEYHDKLKEMVEEGMIEKEVLFDILKKIYERHETEEKIEDFEAILDASLGIDIRTKTPFEIIEKPGIVDLAGLAEKGFILTDPRDLPEEKVDESLIIEKIEMAEIEEETGKISRIKFSGKGEPNTLLLLFVYSQPIVVSIKTDQNGYWEYQFEEELPDGEHSVYIARIDESGLIQSRSKPFRFIKEAQAIEFTPEVSMVTGSSDEGFFSIVIILLVVIILTAALLLTLLIIGSKKTPKITSDVH